VSYFEVYVLFKKKSYREDDCFNLIVLICLHYHYQLVVFCCVVWAQ